MANPKEQNVIRANIDGIENLKAGEGVKIAEDTKYEYGANLSAEGVPLIDPGTGKTISIRVFIFKIDPKKIRNFPIDKQLLFNSHAKQISTILWGDGLIPFDGALPRVIINLKDGFYQIFVPCEARRGVMFMDKAKNLSEELAKGKLEQPKAN